MPSLEYFFVSESYAVDRSSGDVSAFNIISEIDFVEAPVSIPRLIALSCWINSEADIESDEDVHLLLKVKAPGEQQEREFRSSFLPDTRICQIVTDIRNASFTEPGDVKFELIMNGQSIASHTIILSESSSSPR